MSTTIAIATHPGELATAQRQIIDWCDRKIESSLAIIADLKASIALTKSNGLRATSLVSSLARETKLKVYYSKVKAAIEAGYYLVPSFPVDIFAIRTKRDEPLPNYSHSRWDDFQQSADSLPQGEGRYVSDIPERNVEESPTDKDPNRMMYWPSAFQDVSLPVTVTKPVLVESLNRAMALKLFDAFGILPARKRKTDPLITGIINGPNNKEAHFMIAWWIDERML